MSRRERVLTFIQQSDKPVTLRQIVNGLDGNYASTNSTLGILYREGVLDRIRVDTEDRRGGIAYAYTMSDGADTMTNDDLARRLADTEANNALYLNQIALLNARLAAALADTWECQSCGARFPRRNSDSDSDLCSRCVELATLQDDARNVWAALNTAGVGLPGARNGVRMELLVRERDSWRTIAEESRIRLRQADQDLAGALVAAGDSARECKQLAALLHRAERERDDALDMLEQ